METKAKNKNGQHKQHTIRQMADKSSQLPQKLNLDVFTHVLALWITSVPHAPHPQFQCWSVVGFAVANFCPQNVRGNRSEWQANIDIRGRGGKAKHTLPKHALNIVANFRLIAVALDAVLGDMEKLFFKTHFEIFHTATWHRHNQGRYTCARISSLVLLSLVPHTARHAAWFLHRMGPNYTGVTKDLSGFVSGISPHAPVDSCKRNTLGPVARSSPRFDL
jgi:hypothetical protein